MKYLLLDEQKFIIGVFEKPVHENMIKISEGLFETLLNRYSRNQYVGESTKEELGEEDAILFNSVKEDKKEVEVNTEELLRRIKELEAMVVSSIKE